MHRLNSALRILLVICALAFTAAAQSGTVGGGGIQNQGGTVVNQSSPPIASDIAGGSQPHTNVSANWGLGFIISLLMNSMP